MSPTDFGPGNRSYAYAEPIALKIIRHYRRDAGEGSRRRGLARLGREEGTSPTRGVGWVGSRPGRHSNVPGFFGRKRARQ